MFAGFLHLVKYDHVKQVFKVTRNDLFCEKAVEVRKFIFHCYNVCLGP